jgi:hypothetical protein
VLDSNLFRWHSDHHNQLYSRSSNSLNGLWLKVRHSTRSRRGTSRNSDSHTHNLRSKAHLSNLCRQTNSDKYSNCNHTIFDKDLYPLRCIRNPKLVMALIMRLDSSAILRSLTASQTLPMRKCLLVWPRNNSLCNNSMRQHHNF